jgi:hypothetical protein
LTVVNPGSQFKWESRSEAGLSWRSFDLPMLGWEICYALDGNLLIISNSNEMIKEVLKSHEKRELSSVSAEINELTIIRFDRRKESLDDIVNVLDEDAIKQSQHGDDSSSKGSQEFFSGNIRSLLDVASDVRRIEIKRSSQGNNLHEEIEFVLQ